MIVTTRFKLRHAPDSRADASYASGAMGELEVVPRKLVWMYPCLVPSERHETKRGRA